MEQSAQAELIHFERYTARVLDGVTSITLTVNGKATLQERAVDLAAVQIASFNSKHFKTRDELSSVAFKMIRPCGQITTWFEHQLGKSANIVHIQVGFMSEDSALRCYAALNGKTYTPTVQTSADPVRSIQVSPRLFEAGKSWYVLTPSEFRNLRPPALSALTSARRLEQRFNISTDLALPLGERPIKVHPFTKAVSKFVKWEQAFNAQSAPAFQVPPTSIALNETILSSSVTPRNTTSGPSYATQAGQSVGQVAARQPNFGASVRGPVAPAALLSGNSHNRRWYGGSYFRWSGTEELARAEKMVEDDLKAEDWREDVAFEQLAGLEAATTTISHLRSLALHDLKQGSSSDLTWTLGTIPPIGIRRVLTQTPKAILERLDLIDKIKVHPIDVEVQDGTTREALDLKKAMQSEATSASGWVRWGVGYRPPPLTTIADAQQSDLKGHWDDGWD